MLRLDIGDKPYERFQRRFVAIATYRQRGMLKLCLVEKAEGRAFNGAAG